jgi:hypothetical protein
MRRPQRQILRRRDATHRFIARWSRWWEAARVHPTGRSPQAMAALAVLAGILVLFAGSGAGWASRHSSAVATLPKPALKAVMGRSRMAPPLPAVGLWRDTTDNTTYTVPLVPQPSTDSVFKFDFTTPLGEHIQAPLVLVQLADGTYAQGLGIANGDKSLPTAGAGCFGGTLQTDDKLPTPIFIYFLSHISQDGLAAYATLSYILSGNKLNFGLFCDKGDHQGPGTTTYQLQAGCTLDSCEDLTAAAGPTVDKFDTEVLAAEQNGNWSNVYPFTSQQISAQYPPAEFAALLNQQVGSVGKITKMSEPLSPPAPAYTPEGQAYFEVQQTITVLQHGASSTRTLTSYYLLENAAWHFWFSD